MSRGPSAASIYAASRALGVSVRFASLIAIPDDITTLAAETTLRNCYALFQLFAFHVC